MSREQLDAAHAAEDEADERHEQQQAPQRSAGDEIAAVLFG